MCLADYLVSVCKLLCGLFPLDWGRSDEPQKSFLGVEIFRKYCNLYITLRSNQSSASKTVSLHGDCGGGLERENSEGEEIRQQVILVVKCKIMRAGTRVMAVGREKERH